MAVAPVTSDVKKGRLTQFGHFEHKEDADGMEVNRTRHGLPEEDMVGLC